MPVPGPDVVPTEVNTALLIYILYRQKITIQAIVDIAHNVEGVDPQKLRHRYQNWRGDD